MKLSRYIKGIHESGDCGLYLEGLAEHAEKLEIALMWAVSELEAWKKDQGNYGTTGYDEYLPKIRKLIDGNSSFCTPDDGLIDKEPNSISKPWSKDRLEIYVDGSCNNKTSGPGGWGMASKMTNGQYRMEYGHIPHPTTSAVAEMYAMLYALRSVTMRYANIYCDAQYVVKGLTEWSSNWDLENDEEIKNRDLWLALREAYDPIRHKVIWVKGHSGVEGNEIADALAKSGVVRKVISDVPKSKVMVLKEQVLIV